MQSGSIIRVLLADDHAIMRYTLRSVLQQHPQIHIIGEASDGQDAVLKAEALQPEIVLMDINMPKLDGIAATGRIKASSGRIAVIGLSVDDGERSVADMLRAGAVAVVRKERAIEDLYDAIQRAILPLNEVVASTDIAVGLTDTVSNLDVSCRSIYVGQGSHAANPTTSMPDL